jgi:bacteriorhodopsin
MERIINLLPIIALSIGGWAILNGVLHDIFILLPGKKYDRDLLRLLMDGHILITCGVMQMLVYKGLQQQQPWAYYIAGAAALSLLVYCGMIFPFLKSFGMMALNLFLMIVLCISYINKVQS